MVIERNRDPDEIVAFARLMRKGQLAQTRGDNAAAHDYWRKAAMLQPDNEQVWTALMWVLEEETDRRVCLNNILVINPENSQAQDLLHKLAPTKDETQSDNLTKTAEVHPNVTVNLGWVLLRAAQILLLAALISFAWIAGRFLLGM